MTAEPLIFCAVDTPEMERALALTAAMQRAECGVKLGLEFFNAQGPGGIREIRDAYPDTPLFVDLKYHDIPNTVAGAVEAICQLEPDYINVHAAGGPAMLKAAAEALDDARTRFSDLKTRLLGVTVLTSLTDEDLRALGYTESPADRVNRYAALVHDAGLEGIVCAPHEIKALRDQYGPDFVLMVPGVRPAGSSSDDQKRVMTPPDALSAGATHLVIGRPIIRAANPAQAAQDIMRTLQDPDSAADTGS